ncbi:MAG: hypothetical protein KUG65_09740, partial [Sphingomonadaceae bacterium]|nr:hypothetical protein [Sphingomonadaceae bacterium]
DVYKRQVDELRRTPLRGLFIEGDDFAITEIVLNYFLAVRDKWPESWAEVNRKGNFIPRSNAFKAFMRYFGDIYVKMVGEEFGRVPKKDEFAEYFVHIDLTDELLNTRTFQPGSSGQSLFYKLLAGEVSIEHLLED